MSSSSTTEMNLVVWGKAQDKIGEGGKVNERTWKEEQNKNVIALVRTNLIYATSTFEAQQKQVHFLVTVVGEISSERACFYSGNNEECVLVQTPLFSGSQS